MTRLRVQLRRYGRSLVLLLALAAIGVAAGAYILLQQRLPNPFASTYAVSAAFQTAAGVVPGLGEPVDVAGVHVGQISGVTLRGGQAIVHMEIDPSLLSHLYRDASAQLIENTPLKDMQVNLIPGSRGAGELPAGATIPIARTTSPIDADELLAALDSDTRTWLTSLVASLGAATAGRGGDLKALLAELAPTSAQLHQIGDLLALNRGQIAAIVHNLGTLSGAAASKDAQLQQLIRTGDVTLTALAGQDVALRQAIARLPGTLAGTRATLADLTPLSDALRPAATALIPAARRLPATLRRARTLVDGAALLPLRELPPFVAAVAPVARALPAVSSGLTAQTGPLTASFKVLQYVTDELSYDGGGRNPGFLYWLAWTAHNADSLVSSQDAHGAVLRGTFVTSCATLRGSSIGTLLSALLGGLGC